RASLAAAEGRDAAAVRALEEATSADADRPEASADADRPDTAAGEQARAAAAHAAATAALNAVRDVVATATDTRREAAAELATWTARRDALALSLRAQDATADLTDAGLPGILGPLAGAVTVAAGWEDALAGLLGELAGAAVVADTDAAVAALAHARSEDGGGLRLIISGPDADGAADPPAAEPAVPEAAPAGARPAAALVTAESAALTRTLNALLADAWVVPDLETAQALRAAEPGAVVATRDGDVLAPTWATGAGEGASSVLALAAAYDEAAARAAAAQEAEHAAADELDTARAEEAAARKAVATA
ncbi:chromosome segregation protein SMC, partial [Actinomyces sp. Z3]